MIVEATYIPQEDQTATTQETVEAPQESTAAPQESTSDATGQPTTAEEASQQVVGEVFGDDARNEGKNTHGSEEKKPQAEKQPTKETPYKKIQELRKKAERGEIVLPTGVPGLVGLMEKFGVIASAERAEELITMDRDTLKQQDEYLKFKILDESQQAQRPYEADLANTWLPQLKELTSKPEYEGKTTSEVLDIMMEEEKQRFYDKLKTSSQQKIVNNDATNRAIIEEDGVAQEAEMVEEAEVMARSKRDEFLAAASELFGEYLDDSIKDSSFSTFMDNFFSVASARSGSTTRSHERGKRGETISLFQVEQHFRSKKEVVKALHYTYKNFVKVGNVLASQIPPELRNIDQYQQVTREQLHKIIIDLVEILKNKKEFGAYTLFERGVAESMKLPVENATVDDRVYLWFREMGEVREGIGQNKTFDKLWNNFKDNNQSSLKSSQKAA